uniref:Testis-specific chromodomain protein Y 2 n=1 Tax=Daphnia magna TaxID=35525 RepID=A0A0P6CYP8_9CRUS
MSSSVFEVTDSNLDKESSSCTMFPDHVINLADTDASVLLDGNGLPSLPGLDEFCRNSTGQVNEIYNLLGHNGEVVFDMNQLSNTPHELNLEHQPVSENQNFRSSNCDAPIDGPALDCPNQIRQCEDGIENPAVTLLDISNRAGVSLIGQDQLMATPTTSYNEKCSTDDQNSIRTEATLTRTSEVLQVQEPNEDEIDEAFQNVFSGFGTADEKEIHAMLDIDTLKSCLDYARSCPLLICNYCLELFQHIPPFQLHIQTCCAPPRVELKQKMDQAAMDQLARSLWKEVFLRQLKNQPISQNLMQHEEHLHNELDELWLAGSFDTMLKCREIFIRAAVAIVSRRWVANAVGNELHRVRALKSKSKKRAMVESDTDQSISEPKPAKSDQPCSSKKKKTRLKSCNASSQKPTETDIAIRGLVGELDETSNTPRYHFTPETPVSEHGIDVTPVPHHGRDMIAAPDMTRSREDSITTPISDSGVDFTPEMDYELDRFVREVPDVDLLAEAAKGFENLDNTSDVWENNATADEALSENEFVVGKILDRRLLYKVEDSNPQEEDYEYLVSWEGYGEEDNTWEPYEHLKHCTQKLVEYRERLKQKALKSRRGKRI